MQKHSTICLLLLLLNLSLFAQDWQKVSNSISDDFSSIHFVNPSTGYAIGAGAKMWKTTDAGVTWSIVTLPISSTVDLRGLFAFEDAAGDVVYASGNVNSVNGNLATMIKSIDGGASWVSQNIGHTNGFENSIYCFGKDDCVLSGGQSGLGAMTAHTTDGGSNWSKTTYGPFYTAFFTHVEFADANVGYTTGLEGSPFTSGVVFKSTNGGKSFLWKAKVGTMINSFHCFDSSNCIMVGQGGVANRTTDGGVSWNPITIPTTNSLSDIEFIDNATGYILHEGGILKSVDGGTNWFADPDYSGADNLTTLQILKEDSIMFASGNAGAFYVGSYADTTTPTGIHQTLSKEDIILYPNPAHERVSISSTVVLESVSILDLMGRTLRSHHFEAPLKEFELDISDLAPGVYVVNYFSRSGKGSQRLVRF